MTAKPSEFPDYATDANYTSGPHIGTPTKVALATADTEQGNVAGVPPDARKFNFWQNLAATWIHWLEEQWPATDGNAGDVLTTDGAGGHTWEAPTSEITNLAIWSPGVTDAPPIYGTLAAALTAVKAQVGPGAILMHPTTASAFATVASTTYDFDSRVSLYSINNRTLTFGDSAPIINVPEVGCLQDGFEIDVDDGASATGTRLLEVSSNTLRPHIFNLTKSGTARRLVQFTGGAAATERGIIIGRNVTTTMAGDIYSDGKTAVTLRGHGHSFVAGVVENSSAHGEDLEVIYEDAQGETLTTLTSSWGTGSASETFKSHLFRVTGRTFGQVTSTSTTTSSGILSSWVKVPSTTGTSYLTGGVTDGGVSNRLVAPVSGKYRIAGSLTLSPNGITGRDQKFRTRVAMNGSGLPSTQRGMITGPADGDETSVDTSIVFLMSATQYVELQYWADDSQPVTIERMSLEIEKVTD